MTSISKPRSASDIYHDNSSLVSTSSSLSSSSRSSLPTLHPATTRAPIKPQTQPLEITSPLPTHPTSSDIPSPSPPNPDISPNVSRITDTDTNIGVYYEQPPSLSRVLPPIQSPSPTSQQAPVSPLPPPPPSPWGSNPILQGLKKNKYTTITYLALGSLFLVFSSFVIKDRILVERIQTELSKQIQNGIAEILSLRSENITRFTTS